MHDPRELREEARWYFAAAKNTHDVKFKAQMTIHAQELLGLAEALGRRVDAGAVSGYGRASEYDPA